MSLAHGSQQLGPSLVIGGSGFTGSHVVKRLLKEKGAGSITAASRNPRNDSCFDGVTYLPLDVCDDAAVIFHVAAPRAIDGANNPAVFREAIIDGTRHVLYAAKASSTVKALVYTSTCAVHEGYEHFDLKENAPTWGENSNTFPYYRAKALADQMVLAENSRSNSAAQVSHEGVLLTTTLRLPMCYGECDTQTIPGQLEALQKGQTKTQLGDGKNQVEPLYAPVCADAHILAAKALLAASRGAAPAENERVDGEAFFITNGSPQPFWDFSRRVWRQAGDKTDPKDVTVVSGKLALALSGMVDLGFKKPPLNVTRLYVGYAVHNATYSIDKSRERLGFSPTVDLEASIRSSVASTLECDSRFKDLQLVSE